MRLRFPRIWWLRRIDEDAGREIDAELDARHWEADRAIVDAEQLRHRGDKVGDRLHNTRARNHIREAVEESIRRARHS